MSTENIPTVVITIDGGAIHAVVGNQKCRVIILDSDTDGGDPENIHSVDGSKYYVHDYRIYLPGGTDADECDLDYVADIAAQVDKLKFV